MSLENWIGFVAIWLVACFGVGPNSVTCATAGASNGLGRGMWAALGITAASLVHSTVAVFGLSSLLLTYSAAYSLLKWFGIGYLVYLGVRLWQKKPTELSVSMGATEPRSVLFRRAFLISIGNPQAILTYLAFFTPAIDPTAPLAGQIAVLVPTAVGIVFAMYAGYVASGTPLRRVITSVHRQKILNRVTAGFYFFTAAILSTARERA